MLARAALFMLGDFEPNNSYSARKVCPHARLLFPTKYAQNGVLSLHADPHPPHLEGRPGRHGERLVWPRTDQRMQSTPGWYEPPFWHL